MICLFWLNNNKKVKNNASFVVFRCKYESWRVLVSVPVETETNNDTEIRFVLNVETSMHNIGALRYFVSICEENWCFTVFRFKLLLQRSFTESSHWNRDTPKLIYFLKLKNKFGARWFQYKTFFCVHTYAKNA